MTSAAREGLLGHQTASPAGEPTPCSNSQMRGAEPDRDDENHEHRCLAEGDQHEVASAMGNAIPTRAKANLEGSW